MRKLPGYDLNHVEIKDDTNRINFYQGSQEDTSFLNYVAEKEVGRYGFDIIIDDASHIGHLTKISFWHLFDNHLRSGGIYVIEDWGTGYWQDWLDGSMYAGENHNYGLVKFKRTG